MLKKSLLALACVLCLQAAGQPAAEAAEITVTGTGEYVFSASEGEQSARLQALMIAKDNAASQVGGYLESHSLVSHTKTNLDELQLVMADFIQTLGEANFEFSQVPEGRLCRVTQTFVFDDSQIQKVRERIEDSHAMLDYQALKQKKESLHRDTERLNELTRNKAAVAEEVQQHQKKLQAMHYFMDSNNTSLPLQERLALLEKAMALDPGNWVIMYRHVSLKPIDQQTESDYESTCQALVDEMGQQKDISPQMANQYFIHFYDIIIDAAQMLGYQGNTDEMENVKDQADNMENKIDWTNVFDKKRFIFPLQSVNSYLRTPMEFSGLPNEHFAKSLSGLAENIFLHTARENLAKLDQGPQNAWAGIYRGIFKAAAAAGYAMQGSQTLYRQNIAEAEKLLEKYSEFSSSIENAKKLGEKLLLEYHARKLPVT